MSVATHTDDFAYVLVFNSGSSSLKFGLFQVNQSVVMELVAGEIENVGGSSSTFGHRSADGAASDFLSIPIANQREAISRVSTIIDDPKWPTPTAVGHRVVHGGPHLRQHCVVDQQVLRGIEAAAVFAPLHTPAILEVLYIARERYPSCPHVACFDTAFHAGMPDVSRLLPIPRHFEAEGLQRYGFHGLSCESILRLLKPDVPARLIIAHLGNGASVTAVRDGRSIDTSMGLTPSSGIVMGTRSGDIDPGLLIYLMREMRMNAATLDDLIERRSGLAGISGIGSDMRVLHAAADSNADARLAIDIFCYSASKQIAAMMVALGGCDAIVFTGGIGENDAIVRRKVCEKLAWAGVAMEDAVHAGENAVEHIPASTLKSQEDEQIARHTWALTRKKT